MIHTQWSEIRLRGVETDVNYSFLKIWCLSLNYYYDIAQRNRVNFSFEVFPRIIPTLRGLITPPDFYSFLEIFSKEQMEYLRESARIFLMKQISPLRFQWYARNYSSNTRFFLSFFLRNVFARRGKLHVFSCILCVVWRRAGNNTTTRKYRELIVHGIANDIEYEYKRKFVENWEHSRGQCWSLPCTWTPRAPWYLRIWRHAWWRWGPSPRIAIESCRSMCCTLTVQPANMRVDGAIVNYRGAILSARTRNDSGSPCK